MHIQRLVLFMHTICICIALEYKCEEQQDTYSETTSGGKLCGTDLTFSHKALSLVHVHPEGHLGCLPLLLSTNSSAVATHSRKVYPLMLLFAYPILSRCVPECRGLLWCFRLVISAGLLVDSLQLCPCDECLVSVCQALIQAIRFAILKISKRAQISSQLGYMRIWKLSHFWLHKNQQ